MTELLFAASASAGARPVSGVLACWLAADGSPVRVGEKLAEIRLAGADPVWIPALATGTLWHQVRAGEHLAPGAVVGLID